jgi:CRISPR-associated endonuclease/helicase Cas3
VKTDGITPEIKNLCEKDAPTFPRKLNQNDLDISLWIRMLFSCLVDADRLDTEHYMDREKYDKRQHYSTITELQKRFTAYMAEKTKRPMSQELSQVYAARQQILADCISAAEWTPGMFSLTVPTGGGKTLSSMAFALSHTEKYGKKRIIYVIPYTSIIEQNAEVFRQVFGDDEIVEHHSNIDEDDTSERSRLATENWDAPIIVTTAVQFFESLFAAKPGRCRKLHNITNSVVILDEAQLVPTEYLQPILDTMRLLCAHYRVTFVVCTATQPVFEKQEAFPQFPGLPAGSIREIIEDVPSLYKNLERTKVEMRLDEEVEWLILATELSLLEQVLCVVSDRKSCRELYVLMPKGTYHLSALMCAEHRSDVIAEIKERLKNGEPVRVISTQLVEAGVDIDFPVVYRALAGLDSIAQAAGRCNREGKLAEKRGKVVVFKAPRKAPVGMLRKAAETVERMCAHGLENPFEPGLFTQFFSELYWKANSLDEKAIMKLLIPDSQKELGIQFRSAADMFHIIDDKNQRAIVVPYKKGAMYIRLLKKNLISARKLLRKLQRYTINIYVNQFNDMQQRGSLEEIFPGVFALNNTVEYREDIGLLIDEMPSDPESFIC